MEFCTFGWIFGAILRRLPTSPRRLPDDSQTTPRRLPDGSQTAPRRLPDDSQTTPRRLGGEPGTGAAAGTGPSREPDTVYCTVQQSCCSRRTIRLGRDQSNSSAPKALAPSSKHYYYNIINIFPPEAEFLSPFINGFMICLLILLLLCVQKKKVGGG